MIAALLVDPERRLVDVIGLPVEGGAVEQQHLLRLLNTAEPTIWRDQNSIRVEYASDALDQTNHAFTLVESSFLSGAASYQARTIVGPAVIYRVASDGSATDNIIGADWFADRIIWSQLA